jgi:hypothetical protein
MTAEESVMLHVADALSQCSIPYMLAGSFSSNYYGIPRSTKDADFVVQLKAGVSNDFIQRLGSELEVDPQLYFETNTGTYRQVFKHKSSPFKIELFLLSQDPHDQARFERRVAINAHGRQLWLPTAEDVIIMKVRWGRDRDKDDTRGVIGVQRGKLDWPYIEAWCDRHGTRNRLEEIRKTVPQI